MQVLKYNYTNFTSSTAAAKILKAMDETMRTGYAAYIENRKGQRFMRVNIVKGETGYYFQFFGGSAQDLGAIILRAMFDWAPEQDQAFTKLLVKLYERKEHPLVTLAKNAQKLSAALSLGCKELFTLLGNRKVAGLVKRTWWGRKDLWVFTEDSGVYKLVRQTPEVYAAITYREALTA